MMFQSIQHTEKSRSDRVANTCDARGIRRVQNPRQHQQRCKSLLVTRARCHPRQHRIHSLSSVGGRHFVEKCPIHRMFLFRVALQLCTDQARHRANTKHEHHSHTRHPHKLISNPRMNVINLQPRHGPHPDFAERCQPPRAERWGSAPAAPSPHTEAPAGFQ